MSSVNAPKTNSVASSFKRGGAPAPPSLNQLEDNGQDPSPHPAAAGLTLPKGPETKHYYQWSVSLQEKKLHDGSTQTEAHMYMRRPPSAPAHISNLAFSLISAPPVRTTNTMSRQWDAQRSHFLCVPSDTMDMLVDDQ